MDEGRLMGRVIRTIVVLLGTTLLIALPAAAQPRGTMTFGVHVTLATRWLDPADTDSEITPFMILYALHDALVKPMPGSLNAPCLAESWTMSKDGRTWEFVIRKGARFHNGDPVTAEDVKFSFERYKGAAAPISKDRVREVQALESTRAAALKRGEVDVAYYFNGPIADDIRRTPGLTLSPTRTNGVLWVMFPEQWTPGSPWMDKRVRMAASLAIDRQAINEAESLGFSGPTGNIGPRHQEFALPIDPDPYDPKRAKALLAEAGYPNGFDAGEFTPYPPYTSMGEAIANYLAAVGIKTRVWTIERAAFLTAWREKKLRGVFVGATGSAGNASTRIEPFATARGVSSYGPIPDVDGLFQRQLQEMDRKKREEMLHQIQRLLHERMVFAPIWENGFIRASGPRVEESGLTLIPAFPYSGPLEDVRLKKEAGPR